MMHPFQFTGSEKKVLLFEKNNTTLYLCLFKICAFISFLLEFASTDSAACFEGMLN